MPEAANAWRCPPPKKDTPYPLPAAGSRDRVRQCPLNERVLTEALSGDFDTTVTSLSDKRFLYNAYKLAVDDAYTDYRGLHLYGNRTADAAISVFSVLLPVAGVTGDISGTNLGAAALASQLLGDARSVRYGDQTIALIVQRMEADRTKTNAAIKKKLTDSGSKPYPVSELLFDMLRYYEAGTMENALQNMVGSASDGKSALE